MLNCVIPRDKLKSLAPVLVKVILFGDRVFADVIKLRSFRWVIIQHDWHSDKERKMPYEDKDIQGGCYMMRDAEIGLMQLQAREYPG